MAHLGALSPRIIFSSAAISFFRTSASCWDTSSPPLRISRLPVSSRSRRLRRVASSSFGVGFSMPEICAVDGQHSSHSARHKQRLRPRRSLDVGLGLPGYLASGAMASLEVTRLKHARWRRSQGMGTRESVSQGEGLGGGSFYECWQLVITTVRVQCQSAPRRVSATL